MTVHSYCKEATMNQESYSTGSMVGEKRRENWEIYIYFTLSVHFYIEELKGLYFSVGIAKDGLPSVSWSLWVLPVVCSLLQIQNLLCHDSL